jgi:putative heme iron utilization protein
MDVVDVYYVGGFGVMGWVTASDYNNAQPDPLVDHANGIMQHMNSHHANALIELARAFAGIESDEVTMTSVDRLGFHVRFKTPEGMRGARIGFLREANNPEEARVVVTEMVTEARKK